MNLRSVGQDSVTLPNFAEIFPAQNFSLQISLICHVRHFKNNKYRNVMILFFFFLVLMWSDIEEQKIFYLSKIS